MSWVSILAIYFVTWWIVLFAVLPFGVRSPTDAGEAVADGHDAGAPVRPQIWRKLLITSCVSALLMAVCWAIISSGVIDINTLPFYRDMPRPQ